MSAAATPYCCSDAVMAFVKYVAAAAVPPGIQPRSAASASRNSTSEYVSRYIGAFGVDRQKAPKREIFTIGVPSPSLSPLGRPW